jgi:hypothetical protein
MRALAVLIAILGAEPTLAAEGGGTFGGDGLYHGYGSFAGGNKVTCRGIAYTLEVREGQVTGRAIPPPGTSAIGGVVSGTLAPDGTVAMSYTVDSRSGQVDIQLRLDRETFTFTGFSQSRVCRYAITATRS